MNSKQLEEKLQKLEARHITLGEKIAATKAELLAKISEEKEVVPWGKKSRNVLRLKVQGVSNKEIASRVGIGVNKVARAVRQELRNFISGDGQDYTPEEIVWLEKKVTLEIKRSVADSIRYEAWRLSGSIQHLPYILHLPHVEKSPEEVRELKKEAIQKLIVLRKKLEKINHPDFPPEAIKIPEVD